MQKVRSTIKTETIEEVEIQDIVEEAPPFSLYAQLDALKIEAIKQQFDASGEVLKKDAFVQERVFENTSPPEAIGLTS